METSISLLNLTTHGTFTALATGQGEQNHPLPELVVQVGDFLEQGCQLGVEPLALPHQVGHGRRTVVGLGSLGLMSPTKTVALKTPTNS